MTSSPSNSLLLEVAHGVGDERRHEQEAVARQADADLVRGVSRDDVRQCGKQRRNDNGAPFRREPWSEDRLICHGMPLPLID
jgi:hypothetical protein